MSEESIELEKHDPWNEIRENVYEKNVFEKNIKLEGITQEHESQKM